MVVKYVTFLFYSVNHEIKLLILNIVVWVPNSKPKHSGTGTTPIWNVNSIQKIIISYFMVYIYIKYHIIMILFNIIIFIHLIVDIIIWNYRNVT